MPRLAVTSLFRALDRYDVSTDEWLVGVARALRRFRPDGSGVAVYRCKRGAGQQRWQIREVETGDGLGFSLQRYHARLTSSQADELFQPGTRVGFVGTLLARHASFAETVRADLERHSIADLLYLMATEADDSVCIVISCAHHKGVQAAGRELLLSVAEQLRIGMGFRAALARAHDDIPNSTGSLPRQQLRELVRVREDLVEGPTAAADLSADLSADRGGVDWSAVVDGTWSIADVYEDQGRRRLIVFRTPARLRGARALTPRELSIVSSVCDGTSNKATAIELGVSETEISKALSRALAKLGLRNRHALVRASVLLDRHPIPDAGAPSPRQVY